MNSKKESAGKVSIAAKALQDRELERFVLWARDGGRVAEIEMPEFRPRVQVVLWQGRPFVWSDQTRRYVEAVCFTVPQSKVSPRKRQAPEGESFRFDAEDT